MAPVPKIYEYEVTYGDFGNPRVVVYLWDQPVTEEDRAHFALAPEAEVLIYDPETFDTIHRKHPDLDDLWVRPRRWEDIQELLREDTSVVSAAELEKKRFKVAVTREVWEVPYPMMLSRIIKSIREKNHKRNLQIEGLKEKLEIAT